MIDRTFIPNTIKRDVNKEKSSYENVKIIEKSELTNLKFERTDVLEDKDQINTRMNKLITAMRLGNSAKSKVKIYFKDRFDKKCVETTVWYADPLYVTLKGGLVLPVSSIYHINI